MSERRFQCLSCGHYDFENLERDTCRAFPDGIPEAIWSGHHDRAHEGDHGLRYTPIPAEGISPLERRHDAYHRARTEPIDHGADPIGGLVTALEAGEEPSPAGRAPWTHDEPVRAAWAASSDAIAMAVLLVGAGRETELAAALAECNARLDAEACDQLDDKSWLGVGFGLVEVHRALVEGRCADALRSLAAGIGRSSMLRARWQNTLRLSLGHLVQPPTLDEARRTWRHLGLSWSSDWGQSLRLRASPAQEEPVAAIAPARRAEGPPPSPPTPRENDPESFLELLFFELAWTDVSRGTVHITAEHEVPRVERIVEGTAGSARSGYRWREVTCLESSMIPTQVELSTYGLAGLSLHWTYELERAGQAGRVLRHGAAVVHWWSRRSREACERLWLQIFGEQARPRHVRSWWRWLWGCIRSLFGARVP